MKLKNSSGTFLVQSYLLNKELLFQNPALRNSKGRDDGNNSGFWTSVGENPMGRWLEGRLPGLAPETPIPYVSGVGPGSLVHSYAPSPTSVTGTGPGTGL